MRKRTIALTAAAAFALAAPASATVTTADYVFASDAGPGAFTLSCDGLVEGSCTLPAFSLALGGVDFDASNTLIAAVFNDLDPVDQIPPMFIGYEIGGANLGAGGIDPQGAAPDFRFFLFAAGGAPATGSTVLETYIPGQGLASGNMTISLAQTPTSPAPEPAGWALMIAGFGAAGTALRRRASLAR